MRLGGVWTPRQRRKNDLLYGLARGALAVAGVVPGWALEAACAGLGVVTWALWGRGRRRVASNLRLAFGGEAPGAWRVFVGLGGVLADMLLLRRGGPARGERLWLSDEARAVFTEALGEGRGVILATAHLGPWERLGSALVEAGVPLTTVARASYDPRFTGLYRELREGRGLGVLYRGEPGFVAGLVRALRGNRVVGMPMDLGGRGVRVRPVAMLGGTLPLAVGPAELALRTGAALVVATPARDERGRVVVVAERVEVSGEVGSLTERVGRVLEARIRGCPAAWPWMHHDLRGDRATQRDVGLASLLPMARGGR